MSRVEFIEHKGKKILFVNFAGLGLEEIIPCIAQARTVVLSQPKNSVLCLTDVTDTNYSKEVIHRIKTYVRDNEPHIKRSAVVGIKGLVRVLFRGVIKFSGRSNLVVKPTLEEAKDWLTTEIGTE